jgi:Fe-S cluster assembly protein SufD
MFHDITHNSQTHYLLNTPEKQVFFFLNRSGEITFELDTPNAEAHIFALFIGRNQDECTLKIHQKHTAPRTTSSLLVKSILSDQANFRSEGSIFLAPEAQQSVSSQTTRNLLLSKEARAFSQPNLEILADDVICHHAATTSHVSAEQALYMRSRGLTLEQAERLLAEGFINDFFLEIEKLGDFAELEKYGSLCI